MNSPVTVIVLAAGLAGRLGARRRSAQAPDDNGQAGAVLSASLRNAIASRLPVLVVTSADLAPLAHMHVAARDVVVMPMQVRGNGVGDSIAAAVSARADAPGWLVLPGDMTQVRPATLQQVALALQTHAVAYAQYRGRRGHPVGFSAELYSELVALHGDDGARRLVARYPAQAVEVDDPGVLIEVDAVQDLATLRGVQGGRAAAAGVPLLR